MSELHSSIVMAPSRLERLMPLLGRRRLRLLLVGWGVVVGLFAVHHLSAALPNQMVLMQLRVNGVQSAIAELNAGGPLLVWTPTDTGSPPLAYANYPLPGGDDPGLYIYVPLLGHALGVTNVDELLKWSFVTLISVLVFAMPLVLYELFGSLLVALFGPLVLLWRLTYLENTDIYWIPGWALLLLLPLVVLVYRRWGRWSLLWLALIAVVASWASSIRAEAGLPVAVAALAAALIRLRSWPRRAVGALVIVLCYVSVTQGVVGVLKAVRNHEIHGTMAPEAHSTPFHTLYIGLGYLPNKWGITYDDGVAYEAVRERDPTIQYLGARYPSAIRKVYLDFVKAHPGYAARVYVEKARAVLRDTVGPTWFWLVALGAVLSVGARARPRRRLMLFFIPALVQHFLMPTLAMPHDDYEVGLRTTLLLAGLFGVFWLVADAEQVLLRGGLASRVRPAGGRVSEAVRRRADLRRLRPSAWGTAVVVGFAVVATAIYAAPLPGAVDATAKSFYLAGQAEPVDQPPAGHVVASWRFSHGAPKGWQLVDGAIAKPLAGNALVTTGRDRYQYQLESPGTQLRPGQYALVATGLVRDGGLELGALDVDKQSWLATTHFWYGQDLANKAMVTSFTLSEPTTVRAMLDNWADRSHNSQWLIHSVEIVATG